METRADYSTGTRPCAEMADSAISRAREYGEPLDVLPPHIALAVEAIVKDICDRRGIKHRWYEIDDDVKREIRCVWGLIIEKCTGGLES